ncbi:hypothetical protein [Bradyrhizobium sp. NC92]|uniref:hypothetical protein n=1 Tax=Bradyrhizobium sp. (strain NC92) TaxID=55395 RepID=UPI0021AA06ED|nr:hypothetical protein [Bradyrhizobium sp. NC92]UWU67941.1 hypothetical protein N2602_32925 [Bradyrhizobium sp. NC92]
MIKVPVGLSNVIADAGGRIGSTDVNPFLLTAEHGVAVDAPVVLRNRASKSAYLLQHTHVSPTFTEEPRPRTAQSKRCGYRTRNRLLSRVPRYAGVFTLENSQ